MKRHLAFALALASLSIPAFASKNSQNISLDQAVKVGSTQLPAGDYKVSWTGTGSATQVTIARKNGASVTVPAKLVDTKNGHTAVLTNHVGDANVLQSIELDNVSLVLSGSSAAGE